jgi:hypothetical protein
MFVKCLTTNQTTLALCENMAEESVRVANNGVPKALESFAKAEGKWNKLNENLKQ